MERSGMSAAKLALAAGTSLQALSAKDKVGLQIATVLRPVAGDLDIAGPAMAPELPGSRRMSTNRGERT